MKALRLLAISACTLGFACAQRIGVPTDDLTKIGVDELFNIQVTSVDRKAQRLSRAPAAVFVLTAEDIRRSGATSIPEALQWVPGLTVLRLDGRSWIVSARGGAQLYSNKILVMIDGRSLYTPLFAGVIWDSVDVDLEDVEQIEVLRGPGAVMWGPNAVNGVINIITKRAQATKGAQMTAATGNELRGAAEARWGAAPSDRLAYRVWGKANYLTPGYSSPGYFVLGMGQLYRDPSVKNLDAATERLGFRFDGQPTEKDQWMVQGGAYKMTRQDTFGFPAVWPVLAEVVPGHSDYEGGFIQGRWTRTSSAGSDSVLQFSYNHDSINYPYLGASLDNLTVDFQKRWQTGERNEIYAGAGYQQYWDDTYSNRLASFDPRSSVYRVGDLVVRDEWQLVPGRLMGSAGVRIDYSTYHRVEYQPSFRLLYTPNAKQSAWVAVSRAVRLPSRFDRDGRIDNGQTLMAGMPIAVVGTGSRAFRSETERSLEAGYRLQAGQRWSVDASVFWSYYGRLRAVDTPLLPVVSYSGRVPSLLLTITEDNAGAGRSYGGEIWGMWQVCRGWRLIPSYSYLNESLWLPGSAYRRYFWDAKPMTVPHQALLRSQHDLSRDWQLDLMAKARSRETHHSLPGAFLIDARLGWRPTRSGEMSFSVENLTNRKVMEAYSEEPNVAIPIRRTFVIKWTQRL
jgi:iron complex outermembrane receptor protein